MVRGQGYQIICVIIYHAGLTEGSPAPLSSAILLWLLLRSVSAGLIRAPPEAQHPVSSPHTTPGSEKLRRFVGGPSRAALSWTHPRKEWPQFPKHLGCHRFSPTLGPGTCRTRESFSKANFSQYFSSHLDFHSRIAFPVCLFPFSSAHLLFSMPCVLKNHAFETPNLKLLNRRSFSFSLELPSLPGVSSLFRPLAFSLYFC